MDVIEKPAYDRSESKESIPKEEDLISVVTTPEDHKEAPDGGRAWLVLAGCFCGLFCTQGYNYTVSKKKKKVQKVVCH
jgi:hypothetical protein